MDQDINQFVTLLSPLQHRTHEINSTDFAFREIRMAHFIYHYLAVTSGNRSNMSKTRMCILSN